MRYTRNPWQSRIRYLKEKNKIDALLAARWWSRVT